MRTRLTILFAAVALMMAGAVPAMAAPGGVPGPPADKNKDKVVVEDDAVADEEEDGQGPPAWAKAYGKRIKDLYGFPYGHLQQCARVVDGDSVAEDEGDEDEKVKKALEACEANPMFPEDGRGAKAFFEFNYLLFVDTEAGDVVVGL